MCQEQKNREQCHAGGRGAVHCCCWGEEPGRQTAPERQELEAYLDYLVKETERVKARLSELK